MKQFVRFFALILFFFSAIQAQQSVRFELSTAFPFHAFQSTPREYFLTTKYSAGVSLAVNGNTDFISTLTYTQQNSIYTQFQPDRIGALIDSRTIFVPFTSDQFFSEYGAFTGIRLTTSKNIAQVFVKGQMGILAAKYGTIQNVAYVNPNDLPGGNSYKEIEGDVMKIQLGAMYGAGVMFHPASSLTFIVDIHAINRFTKQSLDVYTSVGVQFGL